MKPLAYILALTWLAGASLCAWSICTRAHRPVAGAGLLLMVGTMWTGLWIQWRRGR